MSLPAQNEQINKAANWISCRIDKIEIRLAIAFTVTILLHIFTELPVNSLVMVVLVVLAIVYFSIAFADSTTSAIDKFINKLVGFSLALCVMGILFRLNTFPGYGPMLLVGSSILIILLLLNMVLRSKRPEIHSFSPRMMLRIIIIAAIGMFLYFTPASDLVKTGLIMN